MIQLFGLKGYTGYEIAPGRMVEEQRLLWQAELLANAELVRRQNNP
jgi:hypothetical protein